MNLRVKYNSDNYKKCVFNSSILIDFGKSVTIYIFNLKLNCHILYNEIARFKIK